MAEAQIQQTSRAPAGFWQNKENQKQMIERVGKELGVKEVCLLALPSSEFDSDSIEKLSDWYSIPKRRVMDRGGFGPFIYHKSMADVLTSLYPEYPWEVDKFVINIRHPEGYWDREMQQFIINAEKHLGIQQVRTANENPTYLPPSPIQQTKAIGLVFSHSGRLETDWCHFFIQKGETRRSTSRKISRI